MSLHKIAARIAKEFDWVEIDANDGETWLTVQSSTTKFNYEWNLPIGDLNIFVKAGLFFSIVDRITSVKLVNDTLKCKLDTGTTVKLQAMEIEQPSFIFAHEKYELDQAIEIIRGLPKIVPFAYEDKASQKSICGVYLGKSELVATNGRTIAMLKIADHELPTGVLDADTFLGMENIPLHPDGRLTCNDKVIQLMGEHGDDGIQYTYGTLKPAAQEFPKYEMLVPKAFKYKAQFDMQEIVELFNLLKLGINPTIVFDLPNSQIRTVSKDIVHNFEKPIENDFDFAFGFSYSEFKKILDAFKNEPYLVIEGNAPNSSFKISSASLTLLTAPILVS